MAMQTSNDFVLPRSRMGTRFAPRWAPGQKLAVHETRVGNVLDAGNAQRTASTAPLEVHELVWNTDLFREDATRAMISEAASLFEENIEKASNEPLSVSDLLRASRRYRSVIHATLDKLSNKELQRTFHEIEVCWHICEILFVDIQAPGVLLTQLLSWINWHYPETRVEAEEVLKNRVPHEHPAYWNVVIGFVLRGEPENARSFLKLSPDRKRDEYLALFELLEQMPVYTTEQVSYDFDMRWQKWNSECNEILRVGYFDSHQQLKTIVRLLAGEQGAFDELRGRGYKWFQLMIAQLLYQDPLIKENHLIDYAQAAYKKYDTSDACSTVDSVLLAAFGYDLMEVLRQACYFRLDNWWFVSHFVDLLYQGNQMENHQVENQEKLREFLLLDYADSLIYQGSLWQVAVVYYDACRESGKYRLQLSLERLSFDNERKAIKIIDVAEKRGLTSVVKSIARILSAKWLHQQKVSQALLWAIRSEDARLCTHLADMFLDHYANHGAFPDTDLLSALGPSMLISERLTFLAKYYEFHKLKKEGSLIEAGELLVSLIASHISPKTFLMTLLMDALPLLEAYNLVLNGEQTFAILAALDDLLDSRRVLDIENDHDALKAFKEKEDTLRLAIARNTARSFIL